MWGDRTPLLIQMSPVPTFPYRPGDWNRFPVDTGARLYIASFMPPGKGARVAMRWQLFLLRIKTMMESLLPICLASSINLFLGTLRQVWSSPYGTVGAHLWERERLWWKGESLHSPKRICEGDFSRWDQDGPFRHQIWWWCDIKPEVCCK